MKPLELKERAKVRIEELSHDVDELKVKTDLLAYRLKNEWEEEIEALEDTRHSLEDIYHKISKANEGSVKELAKNFEAQSESAKKRIDHLWEIFSKTLN